MNILMDVPLCLSIGKSKGIFTKPEGVKAILDKDKHKGLNLSKGLLLQPMRNKV